MTMMMMKIMMMVVVVMGVIARRARIKGELWVMSEEAPVWKSSVLESHPGSTVN